MNNLERNNTFKKQTLLEFSKESFSTYLDLDFEELIYTYLDTKNILPSEKTIKVKSIISSIFTILEQKNLTKENIEKIEVRKDGKLNVFYKKAAEQEKLVFNINNKENIFLGDSEELKQQKENLNLKTIKNLEKSEKILQSMDYIFNKNEEEWFDELNNKDILKTQRFGRELQGKNLKELQSIFKSYFDKIPKNEIDKLNPEVKKEYLKQTKKYLEMFMGVGDTYEGGAKFLEESEEYFSETIRNITELSSNRQILNYLKILHKKIDKNNFQSTSVERAYSILMKTGFHKEILKKFIKTNASKKEFVDFAKIITGRGSSIDDNLKDQEIANEALLYMMNKKNGIIDKIKKSGKIKVENKEIENKNPKNIIDDLKNKFYEKYGKDYKEVYFFDKTMKKSGYGDILNISENENYNDLDYTKQVKLGVLYKVLQKLNRIKEGTNIENFGKLFNEVAKDYNKDLVKKLEQSFDEDNIFSSGFWLGKSAKKMGLTGVEAEAFDLFQDIIGNGIFDLRDTSIGYLKTGAKFAGVIVIAMTVPLIILPATTGVVLMGAAMGATASLASMAINPHGYDTIEEGLVDVSTDIALGAGTGAIGGAWASRFEGMGYKAFSKEFYKNEKMIMALDLMFLGLLPEAGRMIEVDKKYHTNPILVKEKILEDI